MNPIQIETSIEFQTGNITTLNLSKNGEYILTSLSDNVANIYCCKTEELVHEQKCKYIDTKVNTSNDVNLLSNLGIDWNIMLCQCYTETEEASLFGLGA